MMRRRPGSVVAAAAELVHALGEGGAAGLRRWWCGLVAAGRVRVPAGAGRAGWAGTAGSVGMAGRPRGGAGSSAECVSL
ncbi:hypothetical protein SVIOM74S_09221 [Streptomyces violarus]